MKGPVASFLAIPALNEKKTFDVLLKNPNQDDTKNLVLLYTLF